MAEKKWPTGNPEADQLLFIIVKFLFGWAIKAFKKKNKGTFGEDGNTEPQAMYASFNPNAKPIGSFVEKFGIEQILNPTPSKKVALLAMIIAVVLAVNQKISDIPVEYLSEKLKFWITFGLNTLCVAAGVITNMYGISKGEE